jgi:hypothetical protein
LANQFNQGVGSNLSPLETKIVGYVKTYNSKGYSPSEIKKALLKSGVDVVTIQKCMELAGIKGAPLYKNKWFWAGLGSIVVLVILGIFLASIFSGVSDLTEPASIFGDEEVECEEDDDCSNGYECSRNECVFVETEDDPGDEEVTNETTTTDPDSGSGSTDTTSDGTTSVNCGGEEDLFDLADGESVMYGNVTITMDLIISEGYVNVTVNGTSETIGLEEIGEFDELALVLWNITYYENNTLGTSEADFSVACCVDNDYECATTGYACEDYECIEEIIECTSHADCNSTAACSTDGQCVVCEETDGGNEDYVMGSASGVWLTTNDSQTGTDYCYDSTSVMEYSCRNGTSVGYPNNEFLYYGAHLCDEGYACSDGACVESTASTTGEGCSTDGDCSEGEICVDEICQIDWGILCEVTKISNETQFFNAYPKIESDYIVWEGAILENPEDISAKGAILLYQISTDETKIIVSEISETYLGLGEPSISGEKIVFLSNEDIYLYNISTEEVSVIISDEDRQYFPMVDEDYLVWWEYESSDDSEIYLYDFTTGSEIQITSDSVKNTHPQISGDYIVWEHQETSEDYDIQLYKISTGRTIDITNTDYYNEDAYIDGDYVVWGGVTASGEYFVYLYEISTRRTREIYGGSGHVPGNMVVDYSENLLAWTNFEELEYGSVYIYDLTSSESLHLIEDYTNYNYDIEGGSLVWMSEKDSPSDRSIYYIESLRTCYEEVEPTETEMPECSDGINNNDGDIFIDYPLDPGCLSALDDDERNICGDRRDNDNDNLIDLADSGCSSLADQTEDVVETRCNDLWDNDNDGYVDYGGICFHGIGDVISCRELTGGSTDGPLCLGLCGTGIYFGPDPECSNYQDDDERGPEAETNSGNAMAPSLEDDVWYLNILNFLISPFN